MISSALVVLAALSPSNPELDARIAQSRVLFTLNETAIRETLKKLPDADPNPSLHYLFSNGYGVPLQATITATNSSTGKDEELMVQAAWVGGCRWIELSNEENEVVEISLSLSDGSRPDLSEVKNTADVLGMLKSAIQNGQCTVRSGHEQDPAFDGDVRNI